MVVFRAEIIKTIIITRSIANASEKTNQDAASLFGSPTKFLQSPFFSESLHTAKEKLTQKEVVRSTLLKIANLKSSVRLYGRTMASVVRYAIETKTKS